MPDSIGSNISSDLAIQQVQTSESTEERVWTASELRTLPPEERDRILERAAERAESEYLNNPELTAFEAFGEDDLYVESSDSETWRDMAG